MNLNKIKENQFVVVQGGCLANNELIALKVIDNDITIKTDRVKTEKPFNDIKEEVKAGCLKIIDKNRDLIALSYYQDTNHIYEKKSWSDYIFGDEKIKGVFDTEEEVEIFIKKSKNKEILFFLSVILGWLSIMALILIFKTN